MQKFRYFLKSCDRTGKIRGCVTIYKEDERTFHRVITLTHPNMKLSRGESIKKALAKYADQVGDAWVANGFKTDIPTDFSPSIWVDVEEIWIWRFGTINMPNAKRFESNVKLCNHEYRMIVNPHG